MIESDQRLKRNFPKTPRLTFKRSKNIKELLCRAKLPPKRGLIMRREGEANKNDVMRCNRDKSKSSSMVCVYLTGKHEEIIQEVKVFNTEIIMFQGWLNCKTEGGFLYFL